MSSTWLRLACTAFLFLVLTLPCAGRAEVFEEEFSPPWDSGSYSVRGIYAGMGYADYNMNGHIETYAASTGVGRATSIARCIEYYTYEREAQRVSFEFHYRVTGEMALTPPDATNGYVALALIVDMDNPRIVAFNFGPIWHGNKPNIDQDRLLTLSGDLEPGVEYQISFAGFAWAFSDSGGTALVDVSNHEGQSFGLYWDAMKVYSWASTVTESGGNFSARQVDANLQLVEQDYYWDGADSLSLLSLCDADENDIQDWRLAFHRFTDSASAQQGDCVVEASAWGDTIEYGGSTRIAVTHWLSGELYNSASSMSLEEVTWHEATPTRGRNTAKAMPSHAWHFGPPEEDFATAPNRYVHPLTLFNTDAVDTLFIPDISYIATMDPVDDLTAVPFMDASFLDTLDLGAPTPPDLSGVPHLFDFLALPPGTSASFPVPTEGNWDGGSIVIRYGFLDTFLGGRDRALLWGRHTVDASTGIGETPPPGLPRLELLPNRPNPFNPATEIRYRLAEAGAVRLRLISPSGRELRVLAEGRRPAGVNLLNWDGRDGQGRALPSGVYLCVLEAGGEQVSRKLVLLE